MRIQSQNVVLETVLNDARLVARPAILGPFGMRPLIYADDTASGQTLAVIEQAIDQVTPTYANTHSELAFCGRRTGRLREGARQAIRRAVHAGDDCAVIFAGSGATAGINKLVAALGLALPTDRLLAQHVLASIEPSLRPVVFIGPYEHHSNDLPWRESLAEVVRIPLDGYGQVCEPSLEKAFRRYAERPLKIGAFSAASNVTGIKTDLKAIARLLHAHGALCIADYAAGAPHLTIDMGQAEDAERLDAMVCSPHKFPGGPGASGVLVARRDMFRIGRPTHPGGGTVRFVTPVRHAYLDDIEATEEAGTPAILGDIRAGLVMALKTDIGQAALDRREHEAVAAFWDLADRVSGIAVLGSRTADRLAIFSFNLVVDGAPMHHGLVAALLNDVFGIQARSGCSCAGPYGHDLLEMDDTSSAHHQTLLEKGIEASKPGWVRLGLPPIMPTAHVVYILSALEFLAQHGAMLGHLYEQDPKSGRWQTSGWQDADPLDFAALCNWNNGALVTEAEPVPSFAEVFASAGDLVAQVGAFRMTTSMLPRRA